VREPDFEPYVVLMTIHCLEKGSYCGTIQYPALGCGGILGYRGVENDLYVFEERIQWGKNACYDGGTIKIVPADNASLKWEWFYPNGERFVSTTVYLVR
jgi:hypothetical protein